MRNLARSQRLPRNLTRQTRSTRQAQPQGKLIRARGGSYYITQKKPAKPTRLRFPKNISSSYATDIKTILAGVKAALVAFANAVRSAAGITTDAAGDEKIRAAYKRLVKALPSAAPAAPAVLKLVTIHGKRIEEENSLQVSEHIRTGIGLQMGVQPEEWLTAKYAGWLADNTDLISSVEGVAKERASDLIEEYVTEGLAPSELAARLESIEGITESKAELIARDQTGKFFSELTQERFLDIGVERYRWQTADDASVREIHAIINGDIFDIGEGDEDGCMPGENYQCRCVMLAVFEDLFDIPAPEDSAE